MEVISGPSCPRRRSRARQGVEREGRGRPLGPTRLPTLSSVHGTLGRSQRQGTNTSRRGDRDPRWHARRRGPTRVGGDRGPRWHARRRGPTRVGGIAARGGTHDAGGPTRVGEDRGPRWHGRRQGTNTSRGGSRPAVARTTPGDHRAVGTFATSGDDCDARANRDVGDPRDAIGYRHVGDARDAGRRSPSVPDWTAGGTSCEPARAGSRARGVGPRVPGRQERRRGALSRTAQSACRRRSRSPSGGCTRRRRRPRPRPRTRGRRCKARAARRGERSGRATRHREPGR